VGTRRGNEAESANRPVRDLPATLNLVPRATGAAAAIVGCLVLAGWILDADVLKRIIPGLVAMNPATAMAFILLGVSLWLLRSGEVSRSARRISRGLAVVVALVGLTKIVQIVFGWEFGVGNARACFGRSRKPTPLRRASTGERDLGLPSLSSSWN